MPTTTSGRSVYTAFLYGHGAPEPGDDWGAGLGRPLHFSRHDTVYRQEFENGVTMANIGNRPVRVGSLIVPPRSGLVLPSRVAA
jgi:hypothetical protein